MEFKSTIYLSSRISIYFSRIKGRFHLEDVPDAKNPNIVTQQKVWHKQPQPPTISGLAFFLGFASIAEFEEYEANGLYGKKLKRARLRIAAEYEKKLHQQAPTGAIFALKAIGWDDRSHKTETGEAPKSIAIDVIVTSVPIANDERDVVM